eukprot:1929165-Rhodomonas_salina.1
MPIDTDLLYMEGAAKPGDRRNTLCARCCACELTLKHDVCRPGGIPLCDRTADPLHALEARGWGQVHHRQ